MAVLRRAGYEDVPEGASITCEVGAGAKGPLVTSVLNVDSSTATAPSGGSGGFDRRAPRPSMAIEGAVKWFEADKGYGFISPDGGGKDVFIHITALRRSGVTALDPGQRVRVEVVDGKKGLEAERITPDLTAPLQSEAQPDRQRRRLLQAAGVCSDRGCAALAK